MPKNTRTPIKFTTKNIINSPLMIYRVQDTCPIFTQSMCACQLFKIP